MLVKKQKRWTNDQLFFPRNLIPDVHITNRTASRQARLQPQHVVSDKEMQMNNNTTGQRTKTGWLSAGSEISQLQCQCHQPALTRPAALATPQIIKDLSADAQRYSKSTLTPCLPNLYFLNTTVLKLESAVGTLTNRIILENTNKKIRKRTTNTVFFF